jgi:hypothetical protein
MNYGVSFFDIPYERTGAEDDSLHLGLALSLKAEKHLETLIANSPNRRSTSSNTHSRSPSQSGNEPTQYGIQYQNRDGDENVAWGSGSGATGNVNGNGTGGNTPPTGVPLDHDLEERALGMAIEETWEESGRRWRPWAANGRATRIGEILLLVDSDTVVPEDCLRDAAREMKACPTVAIIQHESGVFFSISLGGWC